ncbi:MAG: heavy-metal-associated domain-containing protein [Clostridia bacterium]|nr:heavy-metal-associated domain-containing protein [Clostridia bacterium]
MAKKYVISIEGMHCAGCSGRVEKRLGALGCTDINVSLEAASAQMTAPDTLTVAEICSAIEMMGFSAKEA